MAGPDPCVSIIIPVFNCEKYLAEAVASVADQSASVKEIIVVDDGSTDNTPAVARGCGRLVRYFRQDNRGPAAARNRGLELAGGNIVGFLDADDVLCRGSLEMLLSRLTEDDAPDIVKGMTQLIRRVSTPDGKTAFAPSGEPWVFWNLGGALYRSEVFTRTGPFDESLRFSEDIDWFLRAREAGLRLVIHPRTSQLHRRHGDNMTEGKKMGTMNLARILKMSLDRRRSSPTAAANTLSGFRLTSMGPGQEKAKK